MKWLKNFFRPVLDLTSIEKKAVTRVMGTFFFTYFSYTIVRATIKAFFLDSYGAKNSPLVGFYSILALSGFMLIFNSIQRSGNWPAKRIHFWISLLTCLVFGITYPFYRAGFDWVAYPIFIWKEIYIVMLVGLTLGYFNNLVDSSKAKLLYGPMGAIGGLGNILGGLVAKSCAELVGIEGLFIIGVGSMLVASLIFTWGHWNSSKECVAVVERDRLDQLENPDRPITSKNVSPLESINVKGVRSYVASIACLVMLLQFLINLVEFRFNLAVDTQYNNSLDKAVFISNVHMYIGVATLFIQLFITPVVLRKIPVLSVHYFFPFLYALTGIPILLSSMGNMGLTPLTFISHKSMDYSLFSASKELLYYPLNKQQKYGAKYLVDMVVYRASKGLISFFLIFYQSLEVIQAIFAGLLVLWPVVIAKIAKGTNRMKESQKANKAKNQDKSSFPDAAAVHDL